MLVSAKTPAVSLWRQIFVKHWPEYAIEGSGLGLFMISACSFGTLFGHPDSPVVRFVQDPVLLRVLMGLAMGTTAVVLIYSSFGKRSGAHMNPATTLTFLRLGKIEPYGRALLYCCSIRGCNRRGRHCQYCPRCVAFTSIRELRGYIAGTLRLQVGLRR